MEAAQRKPETKSPPFCMKRFALGTLCTLVLGLVLGACPSSNVGGDTDNLYGAVTVSFDKNNSDVGSTEANPDNMTILPPATTLGSLPEKPTRPGYVFAGWNMQSDGNGEAFTEETPIQKKIHFIVYAKWEPVLQVGFPRATLTFSPMERELTFTVTISGLKNVADASSVKLDLSSTNTGSKPLWFLWQEESSPFWEGIQTFVVHVEYRGSDFTEAPASLHLTLKDIPASYEYVGGTRTLRIATTSGQKNNPIPVHQDNLKTFNDYARTQGLALHYQLVENVTLPAERPNNWTAIGTNTAPFTGSFDGGGHSISGLNINRSDHYQGLFGYISDREAVIKNLGLEGGSVRGNNHVGGVVGWNQGGTVQNCYYAKGSVSGNGNYVGGVVGFNNGGTMQDCYATGDVTGNSEVGGVVGWNSGKLHNSYHATGSVSGSNGYVGGVVGSNYGIVQDCYATGSVSATSDCVGGVVGRNEAEGMVHNSYYATGNVSGVKAVGGVVGYNGGTVQTCYAKGDVIGLSVVGGVVGENTGEVHNSHATGSVSGTGDHVGGVAGQNRGKVHNCYATGSVSGEYYIGGVVGYNSGKVHNCYATGSVSGSYYYVGGVAGANWSSEMHNCYATGNVTGHSRVGGVVGDNYNGRVQNCVALNPSVTLTSTDRTTLGRVFGQHYSNTPPTLTNNHARDDMQLIRNGTPKDPLDKGPGGVDGADVSAEDYSNSPFWKNLSIGEVGAPDRIFWDFQNVWDWQEGLLPILREVGGEQSPRV